MTASPAPECVCFHGVSKCFRTDARGAVWALRRLDLRCEPGRLTCVLGPSGCGKTTLLRMAAGLETPTDGQITVQGRAPGDVQLKLASVSQEGDLLPWRRVIDNVALGLELRKVPRKTRRQAALQAIQHMHLPTDVADALPHELSGGMRRRVAIARALCTEPTVLLMDEPFAGLDEPTRHRLQADLVQLWARSRRTTLFVTHSLEEAVYLADRVVVLTFGRRVTDLPIDLPHPRDRQAPAFIQHLLALRAALAAAGAEAEIS